MKCVGVVQEDHQSVLIWDAAGRPRTFALRESNALEPGQKLCFDTHGHGPDAAAFMTPCFDNDGLHGDPEEDCFCGIDTPHIHAHLLDPNGACLAAARDMAQLATFTLFPQTANVDGDKLERECCLTDTCSDDCSRCQEDDLEEWAAFSPNDTAAAANLIISDQLPKQCNSELYNRFHTTEWSSKNRRLYKVRHDDHEDYLVHNTETNHLHLEHPNCKGCGQTDLHGWMNFVTKRALMGGSFLHIFQVPNNKDNNNVLVDANGKPRDDGRYVEDVGKTGCAFDILDVFAGMIDTQSTNRVQVAMIPCRSGNGERSQCCEQGVCDGGGKLRAVNIPDDGKRRIETYDNDMEEKRQDETRDTEETGPVVDTKKETNNKNKEGPTATTKKDGGGSCCSSHGGCSSKKSSDSATTGKNKTTTASSCSSGCGCSVCQSKRNPETKQMSTRSSSPSLTESVPILSKTGSTTHHGNNSTRNKTGYGATAATCDTEARSEFFVKEICCASEIPAVRSIIEPMAGVTKVSVNVPNKTVYVEHNVYQSSASTIMDALNKDHFGANIVKDGHDIVKQKQQNLLAFTGRTANNGSNIGTGTKGRSELLVKEICCASEIPAVRSIIEPLPGVTKVSVNVPNRTVYIDHDTIVASAQSFADALNKDSFGASVVKDAAQASGMLTLADLAVPSIVTSVLLFDESLEPVKEMKELLESTYKNPDPQEKQQLQLKSFQIDDLHGKIVLQHNPSVLSAQQVIDLLSAKLDVEATIEKDGGAGIQPQQQSRGANPSTAVATGNGYNVDGALDQHDVAEDVHVDAFPKAGVMLAGVFWAISLVSLVGGPWYVLRKQTCLEPTRFVTVILPQSLSWSSFAMNLSSCLWPFLTIDTHRTPAPIYSRFQNLCRCPQQDLSSLRCRVVFGILLAPIQQKGLLCHETVPSRCQLPHAVSSHWCLPFG